MAKCLVTGGAGFIGSNLVDVLLESGHHVVVIDDLSSGKIEYLHPLAKFYHMDINAREVEKVFAEEKFDYVFHLAAQIDVRISVANPELDINNNILGAVNILQNCRKYQVAKIIFTSSGGAIYGDAEIIPTPENYSPAPVSPYGINKLAFENYLYFYHKVYNQRYVALRLANVYGPRQYKGGEAGVVSIFINNALNDRKSIINGDGTQTRDYVFVADVVAALLKAAEADFIGHMNIATGKEHSLYDIINFINQELGSNMLTEHAPAKDGEQGRSCLDTALAHQKLAWSHTVNLQEGIARTIAWAMQEKAGKQ
jgi:UDP-glucose 4-epimerase